MSDIMYILTVAEEPAGILSNDNPGACPYTNDKWTERKDDALIAYEFTIPMAHETAREVTEEGYLIRKSPAGAFTLLQIISVEEDNSKDEPVKHVYCENSGLELLGNYTEPADYTGQTVAQAVGALLSGTRWELGENEFSEQVTTNIDNYETVLAAVLKIASDIGAEIQFRVEMSGLMVTRRVVDFLVRRGRDTKKRFQYGKNIDGITRKADRSTVATAIIPLGKGGSGGDQLTIKNVVWSVANGDPVDKPAGQGYIADDGARIRWGNGGYHIFKTFESELEDPARLIQAGWEHLQKVKEASVTYELKVLLLQQLAGYEHELANIGDTVTVYDPTFIPAITLEGRIIEIEISFTDPTKSTVTLGNYVVTKTNITQALRDIQSTLYRNETVWSSGGTTITASDTAPLNPKVNEFWLDTSKAPIEVLKRWNGSTWKSATPEEADDIKESAGRKWAGQSGADITSQNTASDTANVGGKPSDQVRDEAGAGQAAKDKIDTDVGNGTIETVEAGRAYADEARQAAIEYTDGYADRRTTINDIAPTAPVEGDKWIDTSDPIIDVWKVYKGGAWVELGRVDLSQMGGAVGTNQITDDAITYDKIMAGTIKSDLIAAVGLSAEVIKFGLMSGDRIIANSIDANRLKAGTVIAHDVIIEGTLNGATGTFSGSVSVGNTFENGRIDMYDGLFYNTFESMYSSTEELRLTTEITTGGIAFKRRIYNLSNGMITEKSTRMEQTADYLTVTGDMFITGDFIVNQLYLQRNYVGLSPRGQIYFGEDPSGYGADFTVERSARFLSGLEVDGLGSLTVDTPSYINGTMQFGTQPTTNNTESGYCGLQIEAAQVAYTNGIGYGVNFMNKKTYTPSSVSLSKESGNLSNAQVFAGYFTIYGFWFQILRSNISTTNSAWRGFYSC